MRGAERKGDVYAVKQRIISRVDALSDELVGIAKRIFEYNELSWQERRSSRELAEFLGKNGFDVEWNAGGLETAFVARSGSGTPRIALLGEYDALPGVGHACGHNMIGTIGAGAAVALRSCGIPSPGRGTILFVGCPAEEHGGGKIHLVEKGVFRDVDAAMIIHPTTLSTGFDISYAIKVFYVEFFGHSAHAAAGPYKGVNALDAMISLFNGIGLMRQQMKERTRVHGIILDGGQSFNTIPDYTKAEIGLRALTMEEVDAMEVRLRDIAEGAAKMTGCRVSLTLRDAQPEVYVNVPIARTIDRNYELVGEKVSPRIYGDGVGSTDVGAVTQVVAGTQGYIDITAGEKIPTHTPEFAACSDSEYGYGAMLRAVKALALTACDLFADEDLMREATRYFRERRRDF